VFFDNLSVTHYAGPMLEENHYYPFGLQMSGLCDRALKSNYAENKYRYNGSSELQSKEFSDGAGLETYDATFRMYDPQIGRFWQIDPLAEVGEAWSPYSFVLNNPLSFNDPMGLKDSLDPVTVTPFNNTPPCCKIAFIPGTGSPTPVDIPPPPDEVLDIPVNQPTGEPSGEPVSEPLPPGAPVVSPLALGLTAVFSAIPITGNTDWPGGNELFYKEHPEFLDRRQTPSAKNKSASDLYLVRFGDLPESREKLAADAAEAQAGGFPHGVSSFLRAKPPTNGRYAKLLDVMRRFEIKKTGRADHFTIVLPNPVTQQVAIDFNLLFIKR
jgi:RHS repeat-associated protein